MVLNHLAVLSVTAVQRPTNCNEYQNHTHCQETALRVHVQHVD